MADGRALGEWDGDAGDGENDEHGHLEAGVEEAGRAEDEHGEEGGAEGVERVAIAGEQAREQEDGGHGEGALGGLAEAGEGGVGGGAERG